MHSFIFLSVIFSGKFISLDGYSPNDKCVPIGNNTIGRINCEHGKHIHIENMWLDQMACIIEPSTTSSIVTQITDIKCQGTSNCTVPFKSDAYRYFNIWFQCTALPVSNTCPICLQEEKCKTIKEDSTTSISCGNDDMLYISKAWIDKSCCKRAKIIASNAIDMTVDIFSICNRTSKCDIPYHTGKNGNNQLNIIYKCEAPVESRVEDQIKKNNTGGAIAGGVVAGFLLILLAVGVLLYRRRNNDHTKSPRKQFVTRSNPAYESDIDIGTVDNSNQNTETSLYHQYFEVVHDQDFDRARHNYVNTNSVTYDYASEIGPIKDDTYDNTKQGVEGKQQSEEIDTITYSHLQDTFNDSDENTYNHTSHARVQNTPENDYSVSRGQISDDDYDVSGNHYRNNHTYGSETVYN